MLTKSAVIVIPVLMLIAWGLIRIGVRIGAARASRCIVDGFAQALDLKSTAKKLDGTKQCLIVQRPWHSVVGFQDSHQRILRSAAIGDALAQVGLIPIERGIRSRPQRYPASTSSGVSPRGFRQPRRQSPYIMTSGRKAKKARPHWGAGPRWTY
jgi:hypothetical protein